MRAATARSSSKQSPPKEQKTHFLSFHFLKKKKKNQGTGLAILAFTYGFKLFEATMLKGKRRSSSGDGREGEKRSTGEKGGTGEKGSRLFADVEKAAPPPPPAPPPAPSSPRCLDDSARAFPRSQWSLSREKLGLPGFGGKGGRRRQEEKDNDGGNETKTKTTKNSDSFDSAAGS